MLVYSFILFSRNYWQLCSRQCFSCWVYGVNEKGKVFALVLNQALEGDGQ